MKKLKTRQFFIFFFTLFFAYFSVFAEKTFAENSWFVSASGNDENLGREETEPLKTLSKAIRLASRTQVKTITVLGTLDYASEGNLYSESVFLINDTGPAEIVIKGAPSNQAAKSVLSAETSEKRVITIQGLSKVRFENIELSGGISYAGAGVNIVGFEANVTFSKDCVLRNNSVTENGGGVYMQGGFVSVLGADISENFAGKFGGGIYIQSGVLTIKGGTIAKNTAKEGGGIYVSGRGRVTAEQVVIKSNKALLSMATGGYGGGVFVAASVSDAMPSSGNPQPRPQAFLLKSGDISLNTADGRGGDIFAEADALFFNMGGTVSDYNLATEVNPYAAPGEINTPYSDSIYTSPDYGPAYNDSSPDDFSDFSIDDFSMIWIPPIT